MNPERNNIFMLSFQLVVFVTIIFTTGIALAASSHDGQDKRVLSKVGISLRPSKIDKNEWVMVVENRSTETLKLGVRFWNTHLAGGTLSADCSATLSQNSTKEFGILQCGENLKPDQQVTIGIGDDVLKLHTVMLDGELIFTTSWGKKKAAQTLNFIFDKLK
jgi:hypothetical protein